MASSPDIVIIGSGMGGATVAAGLAPTGASVLILERGERLDPGNGERSTRAIFVENRFRTREQWRDGNSRPFNPGNFYYVGGNSKMYGAALFRFRHEDFEAREHPGGVSPAWPFPYETLEPWYDRAEALYRVRGRLGEDPTEPPHSTPYPHPPIPDEPAIAGVRERLKRQGLHPFSLPLGVDVDRWLAGGRTPWDGHPDTRSGKMDAETCALAAALAHDNVRIETGAKVERLEATPGGRRIAAVHVRHAGDSKRVTAGIVVLSAGAVNSAALLLRSADGANPAGLANRSDQVGRHFMNHNCSAMLAIDPRRRNDAVYQKTLGLNDFYLSDGADGPPLGNVQLLGKIDGTILKANLPWCPKPALDWTARRSVDWYLMSEDLPDPESRVRVDGEDIVLDWTRANLEAHERLTATMRGVLKACGYPIVLARPFDRRTPSHQCGTVRIGDDPSRSALDPHCKAWDHDNLYVVDASCLPTSAAVNPALTIAALALRAADRIRCTELSA